MATDLHSQHQTIKHLSQEKNDLERALHAVQEQL